MANSNSKKRMGKKRRSVETEVVVRRLGYRETVVTNKPGKRGAPVESATSKRRQWSEETKTAE